MGTAILVLAVLGLVGALIWWLQAQRRAREELEARRAASAKMRAEGKAAVEQAKRGK